MNAPIWTPSPERIARTNLTSFIAAVNRRWDRAIVDYASLHAFSIGQPEKFWRCVLEFCRVEHSGTTERVLIEGHRMPGARFQSVSGGRLNPP